jgi:hypothetical protein
MAGVTITWTRGSPAQFANMGKRITDQLYRSLSASMFTIAVQAADYAKSQTDRIDTRAMLEAISHEVELRANSITAAFGFTGDVQAYFVFQTVTGFTHYLSGNFIEPTFALRDARVRSEPEVIAAIERAIRDVELP